MAIKINVLSDEAISQSDAICFTSNGVVKKNSHLVMGAGVAKAFANKYPWLPFKAGEAVKKYGNRVNSFLEPSSKKYILSFPTKYHWKDNSDINLIRKSAIELMEYVEINNWQRVYLPYPGVGCGKLNSHEVSNALNDILDVRVILCYL